MKNKRILVVEDEFSINDVVSFALKKEGYQVKSVFNGKDALKEVNNFKPHLVLLDIMLPDMSGLNICKEISSSIYVIMLTARNEVIDKILGIEIGADDYITKPFEIREVVARVNAIFRRLNKEIEESGVRLDKENRKVFKEGKEILLKRKEFDLINFLNDNKNRVYSREELLDRVWGYDFQGEIRTVDVHIRRLRDKLGEDKENSIIETVFGVGYVMR